ncbi:hypothetical protein LJC23_07185 [Desulfovibrio sp. OttesenSCG-928-I05]|nr:hypothetical protein [Desulfovibrio sp. OttesenSCG-928-I05]
MKNTASEETLGILHNEIAKAFLLRIQRGDATPADLNAARQFLKDNGITCEPGANPEIQSLIASIPTTEELDEMTLGGRTH